MEKITRSVKQTPESVKSPLEVRETQNKVNRLKFVKKIPMGLPLSPKQFKELDGLLLHWSSNRISKL